jgi:hypothetical protein
MIHDKFLKEFARIAHELALKGDQYKTLWIDRCKIPTSFALYCADNRDRIRNNCLDAVYGYVDTIKSFTAEWCDLPLEIREVNYVVLSMIN